MVSTRASFGELEIDAEGFSLVVNKVAKLAVGAECGISITECLLAVLTHVWVGPAKANDTDSLGLVSGRGAKGMQWGMPSPFVRVRV